MIHILHKTRILDNIGIRRQRCKDFMCSAPFGTTANRTFFQQNNSVHPNKTNWWTWSGSLRRRWGAGKPPSTQHVVTQPATPNIIPLYQSHIYFLTNCWWPFSFEVEAEATVDAALKAAGSQARPAQPDNRYLSEIVAWPGSICFINLPNARFGDSLHRLKGRHFHRSGLLYWVHFPGLSDSVQKILCLDETDRTLSSILWQITNSINFTHSYSLVSSILRTFRHRSIHQDCSLADCWASSLIMSHILSAVLGENGRNIYLNTSARSWFQKHFFAMAAYLPCYNGHELQHKECGELVCKYIYLNIYTCIWHHLTA